MELTIGMPVYDDYDGVYFTLQNARLQALNFLDDIEFLVIDNNPDSAQGQSTKRLCKRTNTKYVPYTEKRGTAAAKNAVFDNASGRFVMCVDSHVLIQDVSWLIDYIQVLKPNTLYHGALILDSLDNEYHSMDPVWRGGMYGIWSPPQQSRFVMNKPFKIPMHGMGLFMCDSETWPGFNRDFVGFGGEEGYIHEKMRQQGGDVICLPRLKWLHRFDRPNGMPYHNAWEERIHNYYIGFKELDPNGHSNMWQDCVEHFKEHLKPLMFNHVGRKLNDEWGIKI